MAISLEEQNSLLAMISGMFHADLSQNFRMSCLGLTDEGFLVLYDDHAADKVENGTFYYYLKKKVSLENVERILIEDVYTDNKFYYPHRFNVICKVKEQSFAFFYNGDQNKRVKKFVSLLKKKRIKVSKKDFSLD